MDVRLVRREAIPTPAPPIYTWEAGALVGRIGALVGYRGAVDPTDLDRRILPLEQEQPLVNG